MDFSAFIQALQNPQIYPDHPTQIEVIQTHISAIFLTGHHAYKVKKPVDYGFLDFSTLEKRKFYCTREVELNRRLSGRCIWALGRFAATKEGFSWGREPGRLSNRPFL